MQNTNTEGLFRIIQSIPSPKAEPFKRWLAKVGYETEKELGRSVISEGNYLGDKIVGAGLAPALCITGRRAGARPAPTAAGEGRRCNFTLRGCSFLCLSPLCLNGKIGMVQKRVTYSSALVPRWRGLGGGISSLLNHAVK